MAKINKNKLGLAIGVFIALLHAVWALTVLAGFGQKMMDWVFPLHFINNIYEITSFSIMTALLLVVAAFIGGYVMGWIFAWIWNFFGKN